MRTRTPHSIAFRASPDLRKMNSFCVSTLVEGNFFIVNPDYQIYIMLKNQQREIHVFNSLRYESEIYVCC